MTALMSFDAMKLRVKSLALVLTCLGGDLFLRFYGTGRKRESIGDVGQILDVYSSTDDVPEDLHCRFCILSHHLRFSPCFSETVDSTLSPSFGSVPYLGSAGMRSLK